MTDIRGKLERHEPLVTQQTSNPHFVGIHVDDLKQLWELAHDAVHPPENDEDEPSIERGYDEVSLRMQCLQLAQQLEINRLHALDEPPRTDPVMLAESYLNFLKSKDED